MPTPIDRALSSRNLFLGFAGLVALASLSTMFGGDMFPQEADPKGNPDTWTDEELRRWLRRRDGMEPSSSSTREQLVERVKLKMSISSQQK